MSFVSSVDTIFCLERMCAISVTGRMFVIFMAHALAYWLLDIRSFRKVSPGKRCLTNNSPYHYVNHGCGLERLHDMYGVSFNS